MALVGQHAVKLRQAIKLEAFQAFIDEKVSFVDVDEWCDENCARWKIDAPLLKHWIVDGQQNELSRANLDRPNAAKVANLMGATVKRTLNVYLEALGAVKVKRLIDRNGKQVCDAEGKPVELSSPDWEPRLKAADSINKIVGAYAPEKLEVLAGPLDEFAALTDEQLKREIAKYRSRAGVEAPAGIDGPQGGDGLPVLVAECDDDEGRAGRSEPLQALPGSALLSTHTRRTQ